jgi:hypothetical protein
MIAKMYQYPQLHADVSTISWVIPRLAFYGYLEAFVRAGLGKRLMFGSDQMRRPEKIGEGIEAIEQAPPTSRATTTVLRTSSSPPARDSGDSNHREVPNPRGSSRPGLKTGRIKQAHHIDGSAVDDVRPVTMQPFIEIDHRIRFRRFRHRNDTHTATRAEHPSHFSKYSRYGGFEEFKREAHEHCIKYVRLKTEGPSITP